jgi:hypothetical protein
MHTKAAYTYIEFGFRHQLPLNHDEDGSNELRAKEYVILKADDQVYRPLVATVDPLTN